MFAGPMGIRNTKITITIIIIMIKCIKVSHKQFGANGVGLRVKGTVSQTAHVQVINQKWSDIFKFVICETKWRQQAEDNPHSHRGQRNNTGRKKFF